MTAQAIQLVANSQFTVSSGFTGWSSFHGPSPASAWTSAKAANGSGGAITFPAYNGYTPSSYAPPAANAPPGNAVFVMSDATHVGTNTYQVPQPLYKGRQYTLSYWYVGNTADTSLNWYRALYLSGLGSTTGDVTSALGAAFQTFNVANGWQQETLTFTPDQDYLSGVSFTITGIGTDGTATNGLIALTNATVTVPLLIADVTLSTPSSGYRSWPLAVPYGESAGTAAAGNDPRIPVQDINGLWHPRTERLDMYVDGSLAVGSTIGGPPVLPGSLVSQVYASVSTLSAGTGDHVTVDVLLGQASIFSASDGPITISQALMNGVGAARYPNFTNQPVLGAIPLSLQVLAVQGTASNLVVTVWVTVP